VYFNELITTGNKMPEAYYGRGYCYYKLQKNPEAIADFNAYIQQNPTHGMAFYFRGRAHWQLGQQEAACQDFQQALALGTQEGIRMQTRYCQ
jgi:tetratricopeptide (TPR) repeat protein